MGRVRRRGLEISSIERVRRRVPQMRRRVCHEGGTVGAEER